MKIESKVGFDRIIKLEWLDITANLVMQGYSAQEINQKLDEFLLDQIKGKDARRKTRTVLLSIWVKVSRDLLEFRSEAIELLKCVSANNRLAIHWGMSMAVHPFFGYIAVSVGRLLSLQGTASGKEVQRRAKEVYGERQTVSRAVQRLLRTFVGWGVLTDTTKSGVYASGIKADISEARLIFWLMEAFLYANGRSAKVINDILKSPVFFPFDLGSAALYEIRHSERLNIIRYGLDEELIMLGSDNGNHEKITS